MDPLLPRVVLKPYQSAHPLKGANSGEQRLLDHMELCTHVICYHWMRVQLCLCLGLRMSSTFFLIAPLNEELKDPNQTTG